MREPGMTVRMDAVQNDCYTRSMEIALLSDGIPWIIPEGTLVGIRYRKQDMTGGYYDRLPSGELAYVIHENVVTIMLAPQMTTVPGLVVAQLELMNEFKILATGRILLNVEENPASDVVTSEDYINWGQWMEMRLRHHHHNTDRKLDLQRRGAGDGCRWHGLVSHKHIQHRGIQRTEKEHHPGVSHFRKAVCQRCMGKQRSTYGPEWGMAEVLG